MVAVSSVRAGLGLGCIDTEQCILGLLDLLAAPTCRLTCTLHVLAGFACRLLHTVRSQTAKHAGLANKLHHCAFTAWRCNMRGAVQGWQHRRRDRHRHCRHLEHHWRLR